jgi:hypothetical protein
LSYSCFPIVLWSPLTRPVRLPLPLSDLKSPDVQRRVDAYEKIKADKNALERSDVKAALVDLLDRENRVIHGTIRDRSEGYAEYIGELADSVAEIADWHDPYQVCILTETAYNPASEFTDELAVKGGSAVAPCLLKIAQGSTYGVAIRLNDFIRQIKVFCSAHHRR